MLKNRLSDAQRAGLVAAQSSQNFLLDSIPQGPFLNLRIRGFQFLNFLGQSFLSYPERKFGIELSQKIKKPTNSAEEAQVVPGHSHFLSLNSLRRWYRCSVNSALVI